MARPKPTDSPTLVAIRLRGDQVAALHHIRDTTGAGVTWQVRRAVDLFLGSQDLSNTGVTGPVSRGKGRARKAS